MGLSLHAFEACFESFLCLMVPVEWLYSDAGAYILKFEWVFTVLRSFDRNSRGSNAIFSRYLRARERVRMFHFVFGVRSLGGLI